MELRVNKTIEEMAREGFRPVLSPSVLNLSIKPSPSSPINIHSALSDMFGDEMSRLLLDYIVHEESGILPMLVEKYRVNYPKSPLVAKIEVFVVYSDKLTVNHIGENLPLRPESDPSGGIRQSYSVIPYIKNTVTHDAAAEVS